MAPAMVNGRCMFHGGKSTGPRTAEGLARIKAARTVHGGYTQEAMALRRQVRMLLVKAAKLTEST